MSADRPGPHRQRLARLAGDHLATLSPEQATVWLDRHGPLAFEGAEPLSQPLADLLRRKRQRVLAANLHRAGRFEALVEALAARGIPVCPLKGIHLLGTVYAADPEHRPMSDVDVLVRPEDAEEAVRILGSELDLEETALSRRLAARSHERVLVGKKGSVSAGFVVELHTRLGLRTGRACAWKNLAPAPTPANTELAGPLEGCEVHYLDRDTVFAYLLAHLVQHVPWTRLTWIEDVLRWAERGYDAEATLARAREMGILRLVVAGVRALRRGLGADVLPGLPDRARGPATGPEAGPETSSWHLSRHLSGAGARNLFGKLFRPFGHLSVLLYEKLALARRDASPVARPESTRFERHLATVLLADRPRDVVRFAWARLLCSRKLEVVTKSPFAATSE